MAVLQTVHDGQSTLIDLVHDLAGDVVRFQPARRAAGGGDGQAQFDQPAGRGRHGVRFVVIADRHKHTAFFRQDRACAHLRLQEGAGKVAIPAHDFAGGPHFWPKDRVDTREAGEGQNRLFHAEPRCFRVSQRERVAQRQHIHRVFRMRVGRTQREVRQRLARHQTRSNRGNGRVRCFCDERHGAGCAGVHLDQVDLLVLDRKLHVHQADDMQRQRQLFGLAADFGDHRVGQRIGRQRTGAIARVHASLFDMLHDARNMGVGAVAQTVHVHLDRAGQVAVQQHRAFARHDHGLRDIAL